MSVTITQGTQTPIYTKLSSGTEVQIVKLDIGAGTAYGDFGGTINRVTDLLKGTITEVSNLSGGTVQINPVSSVSPLIMGTLGTAGGSFFGTLSGTSGAGTKHYVSGVDIVVQSGTADVRVLVGTAIQGGSVLAAGFFSPSSGISKLFTPPFASGTNSELTYHFVGAGTAFINVTYWKGT